MREQRLRMIEKPFLEDSFLRTVREVLDEQEESRLAAGVGV
jgi:hypothetical protein